MTFIAVNGQNFTGLGLDTPPYREPITIQRDQQSEHIHMGSGNDQRGASIGNTTVTLCACPKLSPRARELLTDIACYLALGILIAGIITACVLFPWVAFVCTILAPIAGVLIGIPLICHLYNKCVKQAQTKA